MPDYELGSHCSALAEEFFTEACLPGLDIVHSGGVLYLYILGFTKSLHRQTVL